MQGPRIRKLPSLLGVALAVGLAACASAALAQESGVCITATVPEAFTLPDGTVHGPGQFKLCTVQAFTPAIGVDHVWVRGEGADFEMSRMVATEARGDSVSVVLFRRVPGSPLEFAGCVLPTGGKSWSYTLGRSDRTGTAGRESFGPVRPL
jgi:hypothetical protein